jgi:anti-sigma-K factor RskA
VRRHCACGTGQARCSACAGNGVQTCARCEGSGRTKNYQELVARFHVVKQVKVLDDTPVADKVVGGLSGDTVLDVRRREIDQVEKIEPEVDTCVSTLLGESHAIDTRQQRILLQDLHVKEIPQLEVEYMYAGVDRRLWICGQEQRVHAPGAPWHRARYWLLVGSVVAAAAAALASLAYVLLG